MQGVITDGYRLLNEDHTLIVPLMRGGEPMAFGVSSAFKAAGFVHDKEQKDLTSEHLVNPQAIILVDSTVNTGDSIIEFIVYLRVKCPHIVIVIVTGVVQDGVVACEEFADMLRIDINLYLVALRISKNKYTGKSGTDSGHRLFNTTYLD